MKESNIQAVIRDLTLLGVTRPATRVRIAAALRDGITHTLQRANPVLYSEQKHHVFFDSAFSSPGLSDVFSVTRGVAKKLDAAIAAGRS